VKLKSYFTSSVEAAMELARTELGEDALLVNARPATRETRYLGSLEVVFGVPPKEVLDAGSEALGWEGEVAELKRRIEGLTASLATPNEPVRIPAPAEREIATDATLGKPGAVRAVVALVGPPGAGKTTTLVKLAVRYGLAARRRTHILTADVHRIAAADQLRSLASLLGIGCEVAETPLALERALIGHHRNDLILIDTPGFAGGEFDDAGDLARLLALHPEMDTHLVLAASSDSSVWARQASLYHVFEPAKLIFTRLDEITNCEGLLDQAARSELPISFLATGQQIPDDLEEATRERLIERRTEGAPAHMGAAA